MSLKIHVYVRLHVCATFIMLLLKPLDKYLILNVNSADDTFSIDWISVFFLSVYGHNNDEEHCKANGRMKMK